MRLSLVPQSLLSDVPRSVALDALITVASYLASFAFSASPTFKAACAVEQSSVFELHHKVVRFLIEIHFRNVMAVHLVFPLRKYFLVLSVVVLVRFFEVFDVVHLQIADGVLVQFGY